MEPETHGIDKTPTSTNTKPQQKTIELLNRKAGILNQAIRRPHRTS